MTDKQRKECPWRIGNCCSALLSIKSARDSKCCDKNCAPKFILDLEKVYIEVNPFQDKML